MVLCHSDKDLIILTKSLRMKGSLECPQSKAKRGMCANNKYKQHPPWGFPQSSFDILFDVPLGHLTFAMSGTYRQTPGFLKLWFIQGICRPRERYTEDINDTTPSGTLTSLSSITE